MLSSYLTDICPVLRWNSQLCRHLIRLHDCRLQRCPRHQVGHAALRLGRPAALGRSDAREADTHRLQNTSEFKSKTFLGAEKELMSLITSYSEMVLRFRNVLCSCLRIQKWRYLVSAVFGLTLVNSDKMWLMRVKQCELILSSLPAKMCQSHSFTVRLHWVNE